MTNNRRKHLYKSGAVALRGPGGYQKSTDNSVPKLAFQHLVEEVAVGLGNEIRFQPSAMDALQEAAEAYMVHMFELAKLTALHAKRTKIQNRDMKFVRSLLRGWGLLQ
ncbi:hypothetical protein KC367_g6306 [Hortaea werneckii]|nr:hypothetical protein KC357_g7417 [Hortaea werneckii]KAI7488966.1 hypothetical protein KC351_g1599 [Hortaea werneckii]KAI7496939.1 hypothetical protein KC367_g6306 [Hortaea werneckii]